MIRTLISLIFFFIWNYVSFSQCTLEGTITSASCEQISTTFTFFDNGAPIVILSYSIYLKDNNGINTIQSGSTISGNATVSYTHLDVYKRQVQGHIGQPTNSLIAIRETGLLLLVQ